MQDLCKVILVGSDYFGGGDYAPVHYTRRVLDTLITNQQQCLCTTCRSHKIIKIKCQKDTEGGFWCHSITVSKSLQTRF